MKILTKLIATVTILVLSTSAFAHMRGHRGGHGFMQSVTRTDCPQYQAMLEMRKDPEAMQAWKQRMQEDPAAMREWMIEVHGNGFFHRRGCFCGYGFPFDDTITTPEE